ncbi:MAG: tRNA (N6-threonylcarbamoyladenosine(37)-N6)-methyltransferase TrmO [Promethearchaeota archaeon]
MLLSYWIKHNNQHEKDIEKWISIIKSSISEEIAQDLTIAIQLFGKMNKIFESAKKKARKDKYENSDIKVEKRKEISRSKQVKSSKMFGLKQIGVIRTPYKTNAPYQPLENDQGNFQIIVDPQYIKGLHKLDQFRYLYVIYYIHRVSREVKNTVSPPWTTGFEVGTFASRSPVRPNLIGLSVVKIKKILNNMIFTTGLDVFDGTPLLDIKPYIKDLDSKCDANYGWIEDLEGYEHLLLHVKGIPHDY